VKGKKESIMRVTTLIENRSSETEGSLAAEWGLSIHIAFQDHNLLFDTGSSGAFAENAEKLSIDIASVDAAILSHHHFDHGGGLRQFFSLNSKAKVYLGQKPEGDCFAKTLLVKKYVGLDKRLFQDFPDRFVFVNRLTQILPDVFILPNLVEDAPKPQGNKKLYVRMDGNWMNDDFKHEIILAIKEAGSLVVFTGCSHNGILNMVESASRDFNGIPIKAVVGGFHLVALPPFNLMAGSKREIEELARKMLSRPVEMTYSGHCTGSKALEILKKSMGERITDIRTGSRFEV